MSKRSKRLVRVLGGVLGSLALLALLGVWEASREATRKLSRRFSAHAVELSVPNPLTADELTALRAERNGTPSAARDSLDGLDVPQLALERAVQRGKHLVEARYGCTSCHGQDFAGGVMLDDFPIGTLRGPNLTTGKGGLAADYSTEDWDRIVRHGIKPDGTPAVMPSQDFFAMSDHELSDIIAYIRTRPPVDAVVAEPTFGPVGKVLLALGKFPLSADKLPDHRRAHARSAPAATETPAFGAHLAATCTGCHGADLAGGPMPFGPPDWPAAANLTHAQAGLGAWSYADFEQALVRGVSKNGRKLREPMTHVLPGTRAMTTTERKALWSYLVTVEPPPSVL